MHHTKFTTHTYMYVDSIYCITINLIPHKHIQFIYLSLYIIYNMLSALAVHTQSAHMWKLSFPYHNDIKENFREKKKSRTACTRWFKYCMMISTSMLANISNSNNINCHKVVVGAVIIEQTGNIRAVFWLQIIFDNVRDGLIGSSLIFSMKYVQICHQTQRL